MRILLSPGLLTFGIWATLVSSFFSCSVRGDKSKLFGTAEVCNGLYREKFVVFSGGAYSAELYSDYLTDSTNFRVYVGQHDESQKYIYDCRGDSVYVRKIDMSEAKAKTIESKSFDINVLKKQGIFQ
jgi:hypothetical protein